MPISFIRKFLTFCGVAALLLPTSVEAQYVRRGVGGGLNVSAPGVNVNVPPINALAGGGRRFFGRRRAQQQQLAEQRANQRKSQNQQQDQSLSNQPNQGQPGNQVPDLAPARASVAVAGAPILAAPLAAPSAADEVKAKTLPTPEKLATMDPAQLGVTLRDVSSQLHVRLSSLKTGAGWQRYLKIPGVLLDAPLNNPDLVAKTLAKYDSIAGNPRYAKLAGMPTFIATGATLRELAEVSQGPQLNISGSDRGVATRQQNVVSDVAEEILPTPAEPQQPDATRGERSILKRASR